MRISDEEIETVNERKDKFISNIYKIKIEELLLNSKQLTGLFINKKDAQIKSKQEADLINFRSNYLS
jgi:hypothetical protein